MLETDLTQESKQEGSEEENLLLTWSSHLFLFQPFPGPNSAPDCCVKSVQQEPKLARAQKQNCSPFPLSSHAKPGLGFIRAQVNKSEKTPVSWEKHLGEKKGFQRNLPLPTAPVQAVSFPPVSHFSPVTSNCFQG